MEFFILAAIGCGVFGFCMAVFLIRSRKETSPGNLHVCGQDDTCQCRKDGPSSLLDTGRSEFRK